MMDHRELIARLGCASQLEQCGGGRWKGPAGLERESLPVDGFWLQYW